MAILDKWSAQKVYWSSFGMPAYQENTVPDDKKDKYPYLTYQAVNGQLGGQLTASANLYYKGTSWATIMQEVGQMEKAIDRQVFIDGGVMKVRKPLANFAQPAPEASDSKIRRMLLTVEIEFLTVT